MLAAGCCFFESSDNLGAVNGSINVSALGKFEFDFLSSFYPVIFLQVIFQSNAILVKLFSC